MKAIVSGATVPDLLFMKERLTGCRQNTRRQDLPLDPHEDALRGDAPDPAPAARLPWGVIVYGILFLGLLIATGFALQDLLEAVQR